MKSINENNIFRIKRDKILYIIKGGIGLGVGSFTIILFTSRILLKPDIVDLFLYSIAIFLGLFILFLSIFAIILGITLSYFKLYKNALGLPRNNLKHILFPKNVLLDDIQNIQIINNHWINVIYIKKNKLKKITFIISDTPYDLQQFKKIFQNKVNIEEKEVKSYKDIDE